MNQIELQAKSIEALKAFNSTLVTNRLYPPDAPQVATAVDRGYKGLKLYLRQYGDLTYSLKGDKFYLCGLQLAQETLALFPNLIVYQQLRLLGLSMLVIGPDMDRFAFAQLLSVFSASVGKIKVEGGGLEYITSLGLSSYFEEGLDDKDGEREHTGHSDSTKLVKVRPELVACLFGRDKRPIIEAELKIKMASPGSAVETLAAGVAHVLLEIRKKKMITSSPAFPLMLARTEALIAGSDQHEVALGLAKILVQNLKELALCVLLAQDYAGTFGRDLYQCLIGLLNKEQLTRVMLVFREQIARERKAGGTQSAQVQFLGRVLLAVMKSEKGKQFLSSEKAKTLIHQGERERKKRRLEAGIKGFLQGDRERLQSAELVEYLPEAVQQLGRKRAEGDVVLLLKEIVASVKDGGRGVKQLLVASVISIGENLLAEGRYQQLNIIISSLKEEVRNGNSSAEQIEKNVAFMQQAMQKSWQDGENGLADDILTFFYHIRSGKIPQPASIKAIVGKVQDKGIRRAHLPRLLGQCLANPKDEILSARLVTQGPVALRFLVESLIHTDDAADRVKIIDLLTDNPNFLPAVVLERLQEHMAWHGKRNLIKLLGEIGGEDDAEALFPFLSHDDLRVQGETFLTLYKIGGKNRKRLLLRALQESSELLKLQIIGALGKICDPEVAVKLVELLSSHAQFGEKNRNAILLQLVETLGKCPCPQAHKGVQSFLRTRGQKATKKISDQVWEAAKKAVKFLHIELQETRKKHIQASQLRKNAVMQAGKLSKGAAGGRGTTGSAEEQGIRELLSREDKATASQQLLEQIERAARSGNFVQAEKLRSWLAEFNPEALSLHLKASEMLERKKSSGSLDKTHLDIWTDLYDVLTTAEFSAIYNGLKHQNFHDEETIISQGDLRGALFFINSGVVKLSFDDGSSDALVKTMEQGSIFGAEAFFEASVWTISAAAIGKCEILSLDLDFLDQWREKFPDLEVKLEKYCEKFQISEDFLKESVSERRQHQRHSITGRLATTLLDSRGRTVGSDFTVKLSDISKGGLSFLLRISRKEKGRLLLGRKMQLPFPLQSASGKEIQLTGKIVAVKKTSTKENNYSLHMKFDQLLGQEELSEIVTTMQRTSQVSS